MLPFDAELTGSSATFCLLGVQEALARPHLWAGWLAERPGMALTQLDQQMNLS